MIFVDSGAWFARVVEDDLDHAAAHAFFQQNEEELLVTDYIVDETLTLLRARGESKKALQLGELFFYADDVYVHYLSKNDIRLSWEIFLKFEDKDWSFTDCTSKYVCEKFEIVTAVSFDRHFRQFGTVSVLP